ncbi:MGMT family protein [Pseudocolwellia sp. HL-MZ19]|uniref:MGMT family protein n=1 Tax=unclassified Pseudocolwellia TaxID=2848178 RepID=UPI003CF05263
MVDAVSNKKAHDKGNEKANANLPYIKIWKTVQTIPYGSVACYGQIADLAGLPGRARLVGKALGKVPKEGWNNQAVPWFRVINSQGKISFAPGSDAFIRQKGLLQDEQVVVIGSRVKLAEFQWTPDLAELLFKLEF